MSPTELTKRVANAVGGGTGLLALTLAAAAGIALASTSQSSQELTALATPASRDSARVTIWYAFRVSDCGLSYELLQELNALAEAPSVEVRGVMLDPIQDAAEARRVTDALGMDFGVTRDLDGAWRRAAVASSQPDPFFIIFQGRARVGIVTPQIMRTLRGYLPSALDLGKEP